MQMQLLCAPDPRLVEGAETIAAALYGQEVAGLDEFPDRFIRVCGSPRGSAYPHSNTFSPRRGTTVTSHVLRFVIKGAVTPKTWLFTPLATA